MKSQLEPVYKIFQQYPLINTDTRKAVENSIFFALKGKNFNANEYAAEALEKGAAYAVIDEEKYKLSNRYILVDDVLLFLQDLAKFHRKKLRIPVIGITGSNGKTTTKELLVSVLAQKFKTVATKGNLNNHIGVPLSVLSISHSDEIAIIEMGANHIGEIKDLCEISQPNYGIITNIGKAHLEGFGSIEGVTKAKSELYHYIRQSKAKIFVNADDPKLVKLSSEIERVTYGKNNRADCTGKLKTSVPSVEFSWEYKTKSVKQHGTIKSRLFGEYNFQNMLAAVCIGSYFNINPSSIDKSLSDYQAKNNRSELVETKENTIILDAYNANPSSMASAINTFFEDNPSSKMLILGDMFELGNMSKKEHKNIVQLVKNLKVKDAIFIGKHFFEHKIEEYLFIETREDAEKYLFQSPPRNKTIFIKGSRGIQLEKLTRFIP